MLRRQNSLDVVEDALGLAQGAETGGTHCDELPVGDGEDKGVVGAGAPPLPRPLPREGGGEIGAWQGVVVSQNRATFKPMAVAASAITVSAVAIASIPAWTATARCRASSVRKG